MTDAIKPPSEVVAVRAEQIAKMICQDRGVDPMTLYQTSVYRPPEGMTYPEDSYFVNSRGEREAMHYAFRRYERIAADIAALTANAPVGSGVWAKLQALWIALDGGPQPRCRDCADHDGNCPNDVNLPCDPQERALEQIKRLRVRSAAPVGEPVAWMMPEHIKAYRLGEEDGIAWANREKTESYTVPLYTHQPVAVGADEIAQTLLDRFIERSKVRNIGGRGIFPDGTKIASLPPSYKDDFIADATAILALLSGEKK